MRMNLPGSAGGISLSIVAVRDLSATLIVAGCVVFCCPAGQSPSVCSGGCIACGGLGFLKQDSLY